MDGLREDGAAAGEAATAGGDGLAAQRIRLFGAAYRMLGSARGAEDVVRDAVAGLARLGPGAPGDPYAWLVREVFGDALHHGETARGRREAQAGPWLPEPVLTEDGVLDRLESAEGRESVSMARLVLLERLPPAERAAYVLHEVFGYGPAETAAVLGLTEARCLAMWRRARQRVAEGEGAARAEESGEQRRLVVTELIRAAAEQDQPALEELLADDVVAWSDGGGRPGVVRRPVLGARKVGRFLAGLAVKIPAGTRARAAEVNGEVAVVATAGAEILGVLVPEFGGQGLVGIRTVSDPARLVYFSRQWAARAAG
ncbi:sigma factor-like helix-turn-helix DNA-binding protein [Streptomyces sp.]|uniref:sigma factor-like helix-turn-helix DNA-binding protein n=1 Tax=Streptomyces sp. TaxID=1931 RepID=UPI002F3E7DEB